MPSEERPKILVGMSGGVDSAVAAALLTEQGYDCVGVTLRLTPEHGKQSPFEPCCGLEAAQDARRACDALGIPHHVVYALDRFEHDVIAPFVEAYRAGRTPNPCILCNRRIKFAVLAEHARKTGAGRIAMGHYARIEERDGRFALRRGLHRPKDQSYVLASLTQEQLACTLFPLGGMTKDAVREHARQRGMNVAARPESQEICFVPSDDYAGFITERSGGMAHGPILSAQGERLGRHRGLIHYTIGQRRGLGIAAPRPLYVLRLDPVKNAVIVGFEEETFCAAFTTGPLHWVGSAPREAPFECRVQVRSRHDATPATVTPNADGAAVRFETPQRSVTPGQWAVFYDDEDFVLAAGVIEAFESAA